MSSITSPNYVDYPGMCDLDDAEVGLIYFPFRLYLCRYGRPRGHHGLRQEGLHRFPFVRQHIPEQEIPLTEFQPHAEPVF